MLKPSEAFRREAATSTLGIGELLPRRLEHLAEGLRKHPERVVDGSVTIEREFDAQGEPTGRCTHTIAVVVDAP